MSDDGKIEERIRILKKSARIDGREARFLILSERAYRELFGSLWRQGLRASRSRLRLYEGLTVVRVPVVQDGVQLGY